MLLVAVYQGESVHNMKMLTGTSDPNVVSQVTAIMKKALDDGFDKDPNSKSNDKQKDHATL